VVGFGAAEDQDVVAVLIVATGHFDLWPVEAGIDPVDEVHHGSSGSMVDEPLGVERGDRGAVDLTDHMFDCCRRALAGIDPSIKMDQHDGAVEVGGPQQRV